LNQIDRIVPASPLFRSIAARQTVCAALILAIAAVLLRIALTL
jgi:hypothetical protein